MKCVAYIYGVFEDIRKPGIEGAYGSGCFAILDGIDEPIEFMRAGSEDDFIIHRQTAGEIVACTALVTMLQESFPEYTQVDIYYQQRGMEEWVTGEWSANKPMTIAYRTIIRRAHESLQINFIRTDKSCKSFYIDRARVLANRALSEYTRIYV